MSTVDKGFLNSFYSHFEKNTSAIKRKSDLDALHTSLKKDVEHTCSWVVSSSFASYESAAGTFILLLDATGLHILNTQTQSHTCLDFSGNFQSKIGSLSVPVSISILEKSFFDWLSMHRKSLVLHSSAKSKKVPHNAIKKQDTFASEALAGLGITLDTPLTSAEKIQKHVAAICNFLQTLQVNTSEPISEETLSLNILDSPKNLETRTFTFTDKVAKAEEKTYKTPYLLPKNIEAFVKTEKITVGTVSCQFNCLLDLGLSFHHSNGIKRLSTIMEVLFLGIPCRQEKGEVIREPISSRWNEVTRALQELSQTLYTLKNTLDIENAQKIMAQIPHMDHAERERLLNFSKAAYSFVSWYRSAFDFSLAQQDMWEKIGASLLNAPEVVALKPEIATIEIKESPNKPPRTYKKREAKPAPEPISHIRLAEPIRVLSGGILTPTHKILSLRKIV
jgi:hypothetical protein